VSREAQPAQIRRRIQRLDALSCALSRSPAVRVIVTQPNGERLEMAFSGVAARAVCPALRDGIAREITKLTAGNEIERCR